MVLAHHLILSASGFWPPNDPRGSWSDVVRSWELRRFGVATKIQPRHSVAQRSKFVVYACAILPEHVHLVVGRHRLPAETIMSPLKDEASKELLRQGIHPFGDWPRAQDQVAPMWARNGWKVFLNGAAGVHRAIAYVEPNPVKEGKRLQRWSIVTPYCGPLARR